MDSVAIMAYLAGAGVLGNLIYTYITHGIAKHAARQTHAAERTATADEAQASEAELMRAAAEAQVESLREQLADSRRQRELA